MKIYKPNEVQELINEYDFIDMLVENELPLEGKMLNLSSSYEKLKLTPFAIEKLLEELLEKLGISIEFPRKGDNNTRYDARLIFKDSNMEGIVEIEVPSTAMLDAPRNLLDDIAVLSNRNNIELENIIPIVVCWTFPNKRTDYWNVINDINEVLDIKIKTVSIMAIAVCYWTNTPLKLGDDVYFVYVDNNTIIELMHILSTENVELSNFEGYFAPFK